MHFINCIILEHKALGKDHQKAFAFGVTRLQTIKTALKVFFCTTIKNLTDAITTCLHGSLGSNQSGIESLDLKKL